MRNVYKQDIEYFWNHYSSMIDLVEDEEFLTTKNSDLQDYLKINYSKMVSDIIKKAEQDGKSKKEIKYEVLKLNRALVRLCKQYVIVGDFKISYSERDIFQEFPAFDKADFDILPSPTTVSKLRVDLIKRNINEYNEQARQQGKHEICELREVKPFLVNKLGIDVRNATILAMLYKDNEEKERIWNK